MTQYLQQYGIPIFIKSRFLAFPYCYVYVNSCRLYRKPFAIDFCWEYDNYSFVALDNRKDSYFGKQRNLSIYAFESIYFNSRYDEINLHPDLDPSHYGNNLLYKKHLLCFLEIEKKPNRLIWKLDTGQSIRYEPTFWRYEWYNDEGSLVMWARFPYNDPFKIMKGIFLEGYILDENLRLYLQGIFTATYFTARGG